MSGVYEALKDLIDQEKGAALATLVRGDEHVGAKLLVRIHAVEAYISHLAAAEASEFLHLAQIEGRRRSLWRAHAEEVCPFNVMEPEGRPCIRRERGACAGADRLDG